MNIDIEKLGYRWQGLYSQYLAYKENDVVFKDGGAYVIRNGSPVPFALGQQDLTTKGNILTGGVSVGGVYGTTLHSNGSTMEFRFTNDRNGTVVTKLSEGQQCGCYPGNNYMNFIMLNGDVRGIGTGTSGSLGNGYGDYSRIRPTKAAFPAGTPKIVSVYRQVNETFYIDADGGLWHSGANTESSSGTNSVNYTPRKINGFGDLGATTKVTKFFMSIDYNGGRVQGCIDSSGVVYMWGNNTYGLCGWGNTTASVLPKIVPISKTVPMKDAYVLGGLTAASYLIDTTGKLWVAGESGSSGYGSTIYDHRLLMPWGMDKTIKYVRPTESDAHWVAGSQAYRTILVLLDDGTLYGWGEDGGQIGGGWGTGYVGDILPTSPLFPLKMLTGVKDAYATSGGYNTCIALMNDGTVKHTGYDANSIGNGRGDATTWATIGGTMLTGVTKLRMYGALYASCAIALRSDGKVVTWGYGASGSSGTGYYNDVNPCAFALIDKPVIDFQSSGYVYGGASTLTHYLLTNDGRVYTMGNGVGGQGGDVNGYARFSPAPVIF